MNFVELNHVSVRYGEDGDGTLALEGTTLAVAPGEFVAVVGPSGCGKSTLMKVVTGLWPPTAGTVTVDGREVAGPLSIVGMAFQNPTLLPWRKTLANVMLPLEIVQPHCARLRSERSTYVAKARDLLALVGLKGFEARFPWELSGGMQQRASPCRDPRSLPSDARRAVRGARHVHARGTLGGLAGCLAGAPADRHSRHPRSARSGLPRRPRAGDERPAGTHYFGAGDQIGAASSARYDL